ncbi:MAG: HNH endonuclease family protein [Bdellovibrionota bacterium]
MLFLVRAYLVKFLVYVRDTKFLNRYFASAYERIFENKEYYNKYYEAINKYFFEQGEMPTDDMFKESLVEDSLYDYNRSLTKYLLYKIENGDNNKEQVAIDDKITIEHIFPRTINSDWRRYLKKGEDYNDWLHCLGNLSLTGYNSEMGNKTFEFKKNSLKENGKFSELNKSVINKLKWGSDQVRKRGKELAEKLIALLKVEKVKDDDIIFTDERPPLDEPITIENTDVFKYRHPYSFVLKEKEYIIEAASYNNLFKEFVKLLCQENKDLLKELVKEKEINFIAKNDKGMRNPVEILRNEFYVNTFNSSKAVFEAISKLLELFGYESNDFLVTLYAKEDIDDETESDIGDDSEYINDKDI